MLLQVSRAMSQFNNSFSDHQSLLKHVDCAGPSGFCVWLQFHFSLQNFKAWFCPQFVQRWDLRSLLMNFLHGLMMSMKMFGSGVFFWFSSSLESSSDSTLDSVLSCWCWFFEFDLVWRPFFWVAFFGVVVEAFFGAVSEVFGLPFERSFLMRLLRRWQMQVWSLNQSSSQLKFLFTILAHPMSPPSITAAKGLIPCPWKVSESEKREERKKVPKKDFKTSVIKFPTDSFEWEPMICSKPTGRFQSFQFWSMNWIVIPTK